MNLISERNEMVVTNDVQFSQSTIFDKKFEQI